MNIQSYQASIAHEQQHFVKHDRQVVARQSVALPIQSQRERAPTAVPQATVSEKAAASASHKGVQKEQSDQEDIKSDDPELRMLRRLVEMLNGRPIDWFEAARWEGESVQSASTGDVQQNPQSADETQLIVKETALNYQAYHFSISLDLQLAEGQRFSFQGQLDWQQLNVSQSLSVVKEQQLKDPLVVSFDWRPVSFKGNTTLDLDGDGNLDKLPTPEGNAGYLVRDLDRNQRMDGPAELLGVTSGDAWADIQTLDDNGDGLLDSRDKAFNDLYWWQPGAGSKLVSLTALQIDAILLQGANTVVDIASEGEPIARLRKTGAFVYHDNQARSAVGLIQQFDFYT
ncbi:hypothetical protein P2G88_07795 [Aliiglaciecola sp. CAU 1673]|uniref:hypothetical protein n=1 Tax=Aliiglaciecola sp. CAU 1673 TaxID=3032595 RepID=UPI0023DA4182|nr:hypothetical protein [Aliiglaciecola sp. CAU 1673]MDF2178153.1 hypothetical protein [Aliiglaciecola sp. CAU 1673]